MMDLLTAIESRASALKLSEPGPSREHIERIARAGVHAPDHGRLRPWRFVVVEGEARRKLGDAMANVLQAKLPQATPEQLKDPGSRPDVMLTELPQIAVVVSAH